MAEPQIPPSGTPYRVLARKYRPSDFTQLIGQEALVRTLTNAFRSGRLAHAFMLTGVRGVGKTTTARIIARALNCVGPDGTGGPTIEPCGVCEPCRAIAEDRYVDVLEMDAASRTGIDDIREIIESVRYRPASARYKVYIIDEVHMLSRNAFNGLLKTLEEPPAHVTFIFATTDVRKVPITVLSRCQRFDLRRVDAATLVGHFGKIAERENISIEPEALSLIARAADGSVRDGLSLLDQAIAHAGEGQVAAEPVRAMLGLADRQATLDILDAVMAGDAAKALAVMGEQYTVGADPQVIVQDLLELVHWLTRLKVVPAAADAPEVAEVERVRGLALAQALAMPVLTRAWQMLLKGLAEVQTADAPLSAAEMVLIRLAYAAHLPTPDEAIRLLGGAGAGASPGAAAERGGPPGVQGAQARSSAAPGGAPASAVAPQGTPAPQGPATPGAHGADGRPPAQMRVASPAAGAASARRQPEADAQAAGDTRPVAVAPGPAPSAKPAPARFEDVVELAAAVKEGELYALLVNNVHIVRFEPGPDPGRIDFRPAEGAPGDLAQRLAKFLGTHTGRRWMVSVVNAEGQPTLAQVRTEDRARRKHDVSRHALVQAVMAAFPGAEISAVRDLAATEAPPVPSAPGPADDIGDLAFGAAAPAGYDDMMGDGWYPDDSPDDGPTEEWVEPGAED
jgi:DNA polymerase-3 subunit gamma/tau